MDELEKGCLLEQGCPNQSVCERFILTRLQMLYWSLKTMLIIVLLPILLLLLKNSVHYPNASVISKYISFATLSMSFACIMYV